MAEIRTGTIAYVASAQASPHLVNVAAPIKELRLRLKGQLVVTGALTLTEDNILRLVRRIQVTRGGEVIKTIGNNDVTAAAFRMYNPFNRYLFRYLPEFVAPGVGVATHDFSATLVIPFALPRSLYGGRRFRLGTCLLADNQEIRVIVDWGVHTDAYSAGTATIQNTEIEVVAVTDDLVARPRFYYKEVSQAVTVQTAANAAEELTLNKNGLLFATFLYFLNNGLKNNTTLNRLTFLRNAALVLNDQSWESLRQNTARLFNMQSTSLVDGTAMAVFDDAGDLRHALALDDPRVFESFRLRVDHAALTVPTLIAHHNFIVPIPGA